LIILDVADKLLCAWAIAPLTTTACCCTTTLATCCYLTAATTAVATAEVETVVL